jgi:hypothetical protein
MIGVRFPGCVRWLRCSGSIGDCEPPGPGSVPGDHPKGRAVHWRDKRPVKARLRLWEFESLPAHGQRASWGRCLPAPVSGSDVARLAGAGGGLQSYRCPVRFRSATLTARGPVLPDDVPSIVVLDELPYLMDSGGAFESVLQRSWDRELSRKPVLLLLIGSDLSMMQALTSYGRPFHQRGTELVVGPLSPADVATMVGLPAARAFDAALVTGGLPICPRRRSAGTASPILICGSGSRSSARTWPRWTGCART